MTNSSRRAVGITLLAAALIRTDATAGQTPPTGRPSDVTRAVSGVAIDGPAPPVAPEVITRDADGRATIRAVRLTEPLSLDGRLDEGIYAETKPVGGFIQTLPDAGQPATENTDVWVMFDAENVYVTARCWQRDMDRTLVANTMRRDRARQNDGLAVAFDTFYDRQNGLMFYTNPLGALGDGYVGEAPGATNTDFNPVWDVRTGRFDGGWTVEMRVPFKSLRYRSGAAQVWGIQFRRVIRDRTETAFLTELPITGGIGRLSYAATLVGIEAPQGSRNLELKPYGISAVSSDRTVSPRITNDVTGDVGFDVKYGLTRSLTADLTVNTDFAQVEVDDQQVNLTRFNLLFPEKREFFLESVGNFRFGGGGAAPQIFYSRQIGLNRGRTVPILAGGRLTGKVGRFSVGALNIQTGDDSATGTPTTNFTVLRLKRDILRRSGVGVIYTGRSESNVAPGRSNQAFGVDGVFSFYDNLDLTGFYSRSETPGLAGRQDSYQGTFSFTPDLYGLNIEHLFIGDDFNPEVGFVRRDDLKRTFVSGRLSPAYAQQPDRAPLRIRGEPDLHSEHERSARVTRPAVPVPDRVPELRFIRRHRHTELRPSPHPVSDRTGRDCSVRRLQLHQLERWLCARGTETLDGSGVGGTRELLRGAPDGLQHQLREAGVYSAPHHRAKPLGQLGGPADR